MSAASKNRLPQLELDCMKVLWKQPGATVAQVRAALPRPLAYTTVMTVLDRMSSKGVVERRKNGRAYSYSAVLEVDAARQEAVNRLLANLFENDREALIRYVSRQHAGEVSVRTPAPRRPTRAKAVEGKPSAAGRKAFLPSEMDESLL